MQGTRAEQLPEHRRRRRRRPHAHARVPAARRVAQPAHDELLRRRLHGQLGARLLRPQPARERVGGGPARCVPGRRACGADRRRRGSGAQLPRAARPAAAPRGGARLDRQPARVLASHQARLDAGRGTQLDVARAQTQLAGTEAILPTLQAAIDRSGYRMATLVAAAAARRRGAARDAAPAADAAGDRSLGAAARHARAAAAAPPRPGSVRAPARGGDGGHRRRHRGSLSAHQPRRPDRLRQPTS